MKRQFNVLFILLIGTAVFCLGQSHESRDSVVKSMTSQNPNRVGDKNALHIRFGASRLQITPQEVQQENAITYDSLPKINRHLLPNNLNIVNYPTIARKSQNEGITRNSIVKINPFSYQLNNGAEGISTIGACLKWNPSQKLHLALESGLASYYNAPWQLSPVITTSFKGCLEYEVCSWLSIKTFGEFSPTDNRIIGSIFSPNKALGGAVIIKFSEKFGLEAGVEYVCIMGKWQPRYYACPVIDISKHSFRK